MHIFSKLQTIKKTRKALSKIVGNDTMGLFLIRRAKEYHFEQELYEYLVQHPDMSFGQVFRFATMRWIPPFIVSDKPVKAQPLINYRKRMYDKLTRFIKDEESEYIVWSKIIRPSMELLFINEMENFVDTHPNASFDELADYCKTIYDQKNSSQDIDE